MPEKTVEFLRKHSESMHEYIELLEVDLIDAQAACAEAKVVCDDAEHRVNKIRVDAHVAAVEHGDAESLFLDCKDRVNALEAAIVAIHYVLS